MSTAPFFSKSDASPPPNIEGVPAPRPYRIRLWRKFVCALVPNWLLRRTEISQGAKLAYARLAQYAGKDGECFPRQRTLAAELGVCERTAHRYLHELIKFNLIESDRPGLGASNSYFFLEHPWIHERPAGSPGQCWSRAARFFRSRTEDFFRSGTAGDFLSY